MSRQTVDKSAGFVSKTLSAGEKKRVQKPKVTKKRDSTAATTKKKRRRKNSWDYEDDDSDVEFEIPDSGSEVETKPRKKRIQSRNNQKKKDMQPVRRKEAVEKDIVLDEEVNEQDRVMMEAKGRQTMQQYEQGSEELLQGLRELAMQEKKTQEKLIEKLKRDITTLSKQTEEAQKKRMKEVDRLVADKIREYEAEQKRKDGQDVEKQALRERIKELEAQFASFKRNTGPDDVVTVNAAAAASDTLAMQNSEAIMQLDQANKLLEVYRLVTSTNIRLIQATDDDEQDNDDCIEIVCTTIDSATGNQFEFELAVPVVATNEIEYLPSEMPPAGLQVPSYLREELSFSRSEVTKFFRSVLDVVIRKKKV